MPGRVYIVGSLRNPEVPKLADDIRSLGIFDSVFDDWYAAGPRADDHWRDYEKARGHSLPQALRGNPARHVYNYDRRHLERCDIAILLLPAGKSAHLELGFVIGRGAKGYILMDAEPERFDVMYCFASEVFAKRDALITALIADAIQLRRGDASL